ncbi:MAG: FMN-dependent NADH-azoreductase [Cellulosilyticaceae bacterium]
MKKILYITVNSKPENLSASKTVGRALVNRFLEQHPDFILEEVDLYKEHIPRLEYPYFEDRNAVISEDAIKKLPLDSQKEVHKIIALCDQFREATVYIIAAPMWSLSFPAPLKEYIDCIVQTEKTITFKGKKPEGLLNDRHRTVIYVQSSGGNIPWVIKPILNKGLNYVEDIMKSMGIEAFEELPVDGTGTTDAERENAIHEAINKIDHIVENIKF